ncbi:MAG: nucleotide sugar dehydrogenase [Candidatus Omnitrophota bacterium]
MRNNNIKVLKRKIKTKKAKIAVIGLGYVGLPLAMTFARKGFKVIGIDISENRIKKITRGISYISDVTNKKLKALLRLKRFAVTNDFAAVRGADAAVICVPTPLRKKKTPNMSYIRNAVRKIEENIRPGQIIVLESTTYPGTTREILLPLLESGGLKEGKDFYLAFSPERIDPGNKVYKTENTPKVIGGISDTSTEIAELLYRQIIKEVIPVSSADGAEMVKLLENTFRIVNTALVNEIATLCGKFHLDIWEIIDVAKTKPYGFMAFYPGPGVGGHCIPVDPLYLSWKAKKHGFETKFINLASYVNEAMPGYIVERIGKMLNTRKKRIQNAKILIVGIAYKKDVKDLRESPAISIVHRLQKKKAKVSYYDPYFPYFRIHGINMKPVKLNKKALQKFDCAVIIADHSKVNYKFLAGNLKLIFDTRNIFSKLGIKGKNIVKL